MQGVTLLDFLTLLAISSIERLSSLRNFTISFLTSKDIKASLGITTVRKSDTNLP